MVGRTHGVHAEPTTFGSKLALWALQLRRDRGRMRRARAVVAVGKLSGAVGTYSNIDREVEAFVCERLGLTPTPATQVIARDRHAEFLYACASVGARSEEHTSELQSRVDLVCRLLLEKKKKKQTNPIPNQKKTKQNNK